MKLAQLSPDGLQKIVTWEEAKLIFELFMEEQNEDNRKNLHEKFQLVINTIPEKTLTNFFQNRKSLFEKFPTILWIHLCIKQLIQLFQKENSITDYVNEFYAIFTPEVLRDNSNLLQLLWEEPKIAVMFLNKWANQPKYEEVVYSVLNAMPEKYRKKDYQVGTSSFEFYYSSNENTLLKEIQQRSFSLK